VTANLPVTRRRARSVATLVWFLAPLVPVLAWSFADRWSAPALLPQELGLRGWQTHLVDGAGAAAARSAALGLAVALVAVALGAMAGRALAWRSGRGTTLAAVILVLPVAVPPFTISLGLEVLVLRLRVPSPIALVLMLTVLALPYPTLILRAAYAALEPDLEAQARALGASRARAFRTVTVPALRTPLLAAAVAAFLVGWSDYVITVVVGGGSLLTMPMLLASALSGTGNEPATAVLAVLTLAPVVVSMAVAQALRGRGFARRRAGRGE